MSTRREEIIEIAKELFADQGVAQTTVRQIALAAGILSGSLYHHFGSKFDIVDAVLREFCDANLQGYQALRDADAEVSDKLREMIRFAVSQSTSNRAAITILLNDSPKLVAEPRFSYLVDYNQAVSEIWISLMQEGITRGLFRSDADPGLTYRFARDVILGVNRWYQPERGRHLDEIADAFFGVLVNGISAQPGGEGAGRPTRNGRGAAVRSQSVKKQRA